jgi:hypothetical protein
MRRTDDSLHQIERLNDLREASPMQYAGVIHVDIEIPVDGDLFCRL